MKRILVVGASSGIGKELASHLRDEGHEVFETYNTQPTKNGHHLDVLGEHIDVDFLPETLDGLVYCPGSIELKPFHRIKPQSFRDDYELQVVGAVKVIQAAYDRLKRSEQASIVLFSTVAVQSGFNFHALVGSSKGAVEGLTRNLAAELAPKVRVNCIAPSLTDTPLAGRLLNSEDKIRSNADRHPLKRVGQSIDMANIATFLLSDKSSWITGQVLHVDGGISKLKI